MKDLTNIKNNDNKCFHIRHLNPLKIHPERITKAHKNMVNDEGTEFLVSKKDFKKIEQKKNIRINVSCYENGSTYAIHIFDEKFKNCMDLLMIADENKTYYVYIKYFNRFMCNKTKCKNEKHFGKYCLQCFSSKNVLVEHEEVCPKINGK